MSKVLGIVIAYKHEDVLKQCLQHVLDLGYDADWVIWNNGELPDLSDDLKPWPNITYKNSTDNLLWTPALNAAVKEYLQPHHEYILFMNHDILLSKDSVSAMVRYLSSDPTAGAVAPVGPRLGGLQDHATHVARGTYKKQSNVRATYLMGAVQMIKREVWDKVGEFDELMPLGADDFDYSIRIKELGYTLWVLPKVQVNHIGHVTGDSPEWDSAGAASWTRFNEKYAGYFKSEEEAIGSLWGSIYDESYPVGTGINQEEKTKRGIVNEKA